MKNNPLIDWVCDYCNSSFQVEECTSEWGDRDEQFYKTLPSCTDCGKKSWRKMDFEGSGHDNILEQTEESELESMIGKGAENDK